MDLPSEGIKLYQASGMTRGLCETDGANGNSRPQGRIGAGVLYNERSKDNFVLGTTISFDFICPKTIGGNVDKPVFLTETNRALLGAEAIIEYDSADAPPVFRIYDRNKRDWVRNILLSDLEKDYITGRNFDLNLYNHFIPNLPQAIHSRIMSVTTQTYVPDWRFSGAWKNSVCLFNYTQNKYDEIYTSEYKAAREDQDFRNTPIERGLKTPWGPVVEVFTNEGFVLQGTNPVGFDVIRIRECEKQWKDFYYLTDTYARMYDDSSFLIPHKAPYYSFIAWSKL